jgi:Uma2 family endonuclease
MAIPQHRVTLKEFLSLPEEKPALEYIDGRVTQKVSPKGPHARLQIVLGRLFDNHAEPRKLGMAFSEARVTFGGDSLVPDVVFYRWDRIPHTATGRVVEDFTTPPDLVVEIISPGQRINALTARCRWYVDQGVPLVLLVDPRRERVMLFREGAEPSLISGDEPIDLEAVLPGFRLTARQLFEALYVR